MASSSNLPIEAEEANKSLGGMQASAVVIGLIFVFILAFMGYTIAVTPGLPWLGAPLGAMAFFAIGAVTDLGLGLTTRSAVHRDWADGKIPESYARLGGVSLALLFIVGGIVPGVYARSARRRLSPLVEMHQSMAPEPAVPAGAPVMPGPPAPVRAPTPAPAAASSWAPASAPAAPPPQTVACPQCGAPLAAEDKFCRGCGRPSGPA